MRRWLRVAAETVLTVYALRRLVIWLVERDLRKHTVLI